MPRVGRFQPRFRAHFLPVLPGSRAGACRSLAHRFYMSIYHSWAGGAVCSARRWPSRGKPCCQTVRLWNSVTFAPQLLATHMALPTPNGWPPPAYLRKASSHAKPLEMPQRALVKSGVAARGRSSALLAATQMQSSTPTTATEEHTSVQTFNTTRQPRFLVAQMLHACSLRTCTRISAM